MFLQTTIQKLGKAPEGKEVFSNIEPTEVLSKDASRMKLIGKLLNKPKGIKPAAAQPAIKTDLHHLKADELTVVWFGHSSYLLKYKNTVVLVDPVLFGPASPVPFGGKPFKGTEIYAPEDLPEIDLLILTHDHYDHLSYETVMKLKGKIKKIVAPLKLSSHLIYWGFHKSIITELGRDESVVIEPEMKLTALPARHFSGRFITRNKTLWVSYALQWEKYRIFIGGDSGYDKQFKRTGELHGPFDIAFIECGQYGDAWPDIHMLPEQTAQAAVALKTDILFPVHWAKFALALHPWNEPIKRVTTAAETLHQKIVTPLIGEAYTIGMETKNPVWWKTD